MDIPSNSGVASTVPGTIKPVNMQSDITGKNESTINTVNDVKNKQNQEAPADKKGFENITNELNKFMQSMNTDIQFLLHTKTSTLMVQVEDRKTHKILKECPAHELLDMVARIREYVGIFLDKKV